METNLEINKQVENHNNTAVFGMVEKWKGGSGGRDYWIENIRLTCLVGKKRK